jgi:hypothetical protein
MLNVTSVSRLVVAMGVAGAGIFVSRPATARQYVMGTVTSSYANNTNFWTGIEGEFQVPPAPTVGDGSPTFYIWTGLQTQSKILLQPVLEWEQGGEEDSGYGWYMQNWVVTPQYTGGKALTNPLPVNPGDQIFTVVELDTNNLGSNCQLNEGGKNCNYTVFWGDWNSGNTSQADWTVDQGPQYAWGAVLEIPFANSIPSCAYLPKTVMEVTSILAYWTDTNNFNSFTPDYAMGYPGNNAAGFTFPNVPVGTGGDVFGNCVGLTYPYENANQTVFWLNDY